MSATAKSVFSINGSYTVLFSPGHGSLSMVGLGHGSQEYSKYESVALPFLGFSESNLV